MTRQPPKYWSLWLRLFALVDIADGLALLVLGKRTPRWMNNGIAIRAFQLEREIKNRLKEN